MALQYQTGTPSSVEDLVNKLQTFLASNGFTVDDYDATNDECTLNDGSNLYVHFGWDGTGTDLNICQSLGYTVSNAIDNMPNDSGSGSATIGSERRVDFEAAGPYTAYHFFVSDSAPKYCHVVVEVSSGIFRHFGFGNLQKVNDWTGGEYAYGHIWNQTAAQIDNPASASHNFALASNGNSNAEAATLHLEGVGAQGASEKWGVFHGSSGGTDTAGETRRLMVGTARDGGFERYMAHIRNNNLNAYVPILPVQIWYRDTLTTPDTVIFLGQQPNVGVVNMNGLSAGDEITLGGETWVVFPWVRKQYLTNDTEESWNAGFAYRKS